MDKKSRDRLYRTWFHMHSRTSDQRNPSYPGYGGRGIGVCDRWQDFGAFAEDMGEAPEGKSLDRINVDGNYEPANCKWSSLSEQSKNRRPWKHTPEGLEALRLNAAKGHTPEARAKAADSNRGRKRSAEFCERMREIKTGSHQTPESIEKMRLAKIGKRHSPEHIEKIRLAATGRKHTPESLAKMRSAGPKKLTVEGRERLRQVAINRVYSPETREKMRLAKLGKKAQRSTKEK